MSLSIQQTKTAVRPGLVSKFGAQGGTPPYVFSCTAYVPGVGGAGGTIDHSSGLYTAPSSVRPDPRNFYDKVTVTDATNATASSWILVGWSWMMVLDIIRTQLGLDISHCYFWDQKWDMPTDASLIVVIGIPMAKPKASNLVPMGDPVNPGDGPGWDQVLSWTQVNSTLDIHIYSRSMEAVFRMPEVFAALVSPYSKAQQTENGFYLSKIPHNAVDGSQIDGAAIPYHFIISCEMIWTHWKTLAPPYFDKIPVPKIELIQS